ncbi:unnamed protein product [Cylindrotheca closterium]|uniref:BAR domain-containing protein n=1 Tax=Cylindrotheca closterium TaxID=2856 RepID=A0AAD2PW58_9STRA|nr:unnamed protein product [Cylindrotheca closterium]
MKKSIAKTRVSTRFKSAVGGKSHNKSEDLKQLTEKYDAFNKCLKSFLVVLKQHYAAMEALTKSRIEMAQHIAVLSRGSPLSNHVGAMPAAGAPPDSVCSYLSTHHSLANKNKQYSQRFAKFVIDYCIQWQQVVFTRVDKTLKEAEKSRVEADHYQSKVESLRQSANEKLAKGKQVDSKSAEKLTRNEEKLVKIKEENRQCASDACLLVEELTDRAWRDLHPLLVKVIQFDMTISTEEAKAMGSLKAVVTELKNIAATHGISEDARLKEIETLAPSDLSTKEGGDTVQVESDMGRLSFTGSTNGGMMNQGGNTLFPSGTTAAQGSGGYPVPVKSNDGLGGMSTVDMVAISAAAAPPPSMDQLEAAFGSSNSSMGSEISAPPASAPPLPPGDTNPFGPGPTPAAAPNPFGPEPTPTTPSMYGAPPTNPFGGPAPSPAATNPFAGPPNPSAAPTNPFADPAPAYHPPPSPYAATQPMAPPAQQYGGQQQLAMHTSNRSGTPSASGYGLSQPYQQQQAYGQPPQQQQQRRTSSNPFD